MKTINTLTAFALVLGLAFVPAGCAQTPAASAQEVTGTPGSPSATTTIDGKQLPPPPDNKFGGKIERNALDSTPYWAPGWCRPKERPTFF